MTCVELFTNEHGGRTCTRNYLRFGSMAIQAVLKAMVVPPRAGCVPAVRSEAGSPEGPAADDPVRHQGPPSAEALPGPDQRHHLHLRLPRDVSPGKHRVVSFSFRRVLANAYGDCTGTRKSSIICVLPGKHRIVYFSFC